MGYRIRRKKSAKQKSRKQSGLPPGTLVFTGQQRSDATGVTLVQYSEEQYETKETVDKLPRPFEWEGVRWYDVRGLHNTALVERIGEKFDIHPLALEDVLDTEQRPKFEEYDNGIFLILRAMHYDPLSREVNIEQVAIFAGEGFVVSFQELETDLLLPIRERLEASRGRVRRHGADYLAYALADAIVDRYFNLLDAMSETLEALEEEIMIEPEMETKGKIHDLKLSSLTLRKSISPLRESINRFGQSEHPVLQEETTLYIRDLYDHTIQIMDMIEGNRDVLNGLYDLYSSELSFRMNNVMQVLTVISTIFIPLSFLAGVYGMNFEYIPELSYRYGYFLFWGLNLSIIIGLLLYFRHKKWL